MVQIDLTGGESGDTAEPQDDGPRFLNAVTLSAELGSESSFWHPLEEPSEDELLEVDPNIPARIGMWAPFLFEDANNDGLYVEGETIGGFSNDWLVYSNMAIPEFNVSEGWGVLRMTFTEEPPEVGDLDSVPLSGDLLLNESLTIGAPMTRRLATVALPLWLQQPLRPRRKPWLMPQQLTHGP